MGTEDRQFVEAYSHHALEMVQGTQQLASSCPSNMDYQQFSHFPRHIRFGMATKKQLWNGDNSVNTRRISCQICGKHFNSTGALFNHKQTVHDARVFQCDCGKVFRWNTGLARHVKHCPFRVIQWKWEKNNPMASSDSPVFSTDWRNATISNLKLSALWFWLFMMLMKDFNFFTDILLRICNKLLSKYELYFYWYLAVVCRAPGTRTSSAAVMKRYLREGGWVIWLGREDIVRLGRIWSVNVHWYGILMSQHIQKVSLVRTVASTFTASRHTSTQGTGIA